LRSSSAAAAQAGSRDQQVQPGWTNSSGFQGGILNGPGGVVSTTALAMAVAVAVAVASFRVGRVDTLAILKPLTRVAA